MNSLQVEGSHARLVDALKRAESWFVNLSDLRGFEIRESVNENELYAALTQLRTRAASTLINIAMFGAFSSGKSFLVSGMQGHLDVIEAEGSDGLPAEKFIGLLPSSPIPMSACPAQIVPVVGEDDLDCTGQGFMRVRFTDPDEWSNVGNSPIPAMVAAYATVNGDVVNRLAPHRRREVAQVEILISGYKLPAKLYDLPGYGSVITTHDVIIKTAMNDADCFIFVTRANRTLGEEDLDLIHVLYTHCKSWNKRVIWVLTGIDEATNLDHTNMPGWISVIKQNNRYLEDNFQISGQPDRAFIGGGFIGVSPASEARAGMQEEAGNNTLAGRLRKASQMEALRQEIQSLIDREAGPAHIAEIASKARALLGPLAKAASDRLREERIPVDEQSSLLAATQEQIQRVDAALFRMKDDLTRSLETRATRASRSFVGLAAHLHAELDELIHETDLRSPRKANQINNTRFQLIKSWAEQPGGPAELWEEQLKQFAQDIYGWLRKNVNDYGSTSKVPGARFSIDELQFDKTLAARIGTQDLVERAAAVVGVAAPVAATATWIGSTLAAGVIFPPAVAITGAAALVYMGVRLFKIKVLDSLEAMQREWIADLDSTAAAVEEQYKVSLTAKGLAMTDTLAKGLESHRMQLSASIERIKDRIADPEYQMSQEFVDHLEPSVREGEQLMGEFDELRALRAEGM